METSPDKKKRNIFVRAIISILRVSFVLILFISAVLYVAYADQYIDLLLAISLIFGPLLIGCFYWVWKGKASTVAHKLFGLMFMYIFFFIVSIMNLLVLMITYEKEIVTDGLSGMMLLSMFAPFIFLPYFEDKATYHFLGKTQLSKNERLFAYFATPVVCVLVIQAGIYFNRMIESQAYIPEDAKFLSFVIIFIVGFIGSLIYNRIKKSGEFKLTN